ncbi:MAG TPA: hypothetical protein VND92_01070 [Vicinamibacterales bacterium]|nr:hypothetical protein [Vicinamibacterales bacterium]
MDLTPVPLLQIQRDLYGLPRGMERFRAYLRTMTDPETGDLELPLVAMNPMGKDHVPARIDELLAIDAEGIARSAVEAASAGLLAVPGRFRVGLVVSDDLMGGWTNRYCSEFTHRFETRAFDRRGWLTGVLWTADPVSVRTVREEVLGAIHRAAWIVRHGPAVTLEAMLAQEGTATARAGCTAPSLDADELAYTREVLAPHLDATDRPTVMACLYGDEAARALGYRPQGVSARAGFALALADARAAQGVDAPVAGRC